MRVGILWVVAALSVVAAPIGVVSPATASVVCTPAVRLDPGPAVKEGELLEFYATLVTEPGCPVEGTVHFRTEVPSTGGNFDATPGTNGTTPLADYISITGTLTWSGGPATQSVKVPTLKDNRAEVPEEVKLCADQPKGHPTAPGVVCATGVVGLSTPMCVRSGTTVTFSIGLAAPVRDDVTVHYNTIDGTAKAGEDFVGVRDGQVKIPVGGMEARPTVRILPNTPGEPVEYFDVEFTARVNGATQTGRMRIDIM